MRIITISGRDRNFLNACSISLIEVSRGKEREGRRRWRERDGEDGEDGEMREKEGQEVGREREREK